MNNSKINNPQKEVSKGLSLNDKDYMTNLLIILKDFEKNMTVALTEASNENLYKKLKKIFDEVASMQRDAYELMFKFGWYTLEEATNTKVTNLTKQLENELSNLN